MPKSAAVVSRPSLRDDPLYTREEAAEILNVTLRFVTRCVQEHRIRYIRVGRMVRIPESALRHFIQEREVTTTPKLR